MKIRPYEQRDQASWDEYVARSPHATLYHTTRWRTVLERTTRTRHHAWVAEDETGRIRGILPLVHQRSLLFGSFFVSLPHSSYGGVCADDDAHALALIDAAIVLARNQGVEHIELRQRSPLATTMPFRDAKDSMYLDLGSDLGALWNRFGAKLRSQIRRPAKDGFAARIGGKEELEAFYRVFATNMRDLGTPVFSRAFFEHVFEEFPEETRVCIVTRSGAPAAAAVMLAYRDTVEIPWASSLRAYKQSAPNMLLYWTAIQYAAERGYTRLDLGRSTRGGGTYHFKLQWGASPSPQYWYYWLAKPGPLPELGPGSHRYGMAVRVWRRLPLGVANALGPLIVRYVP